MFRSIALSAGVLLVCVTPALAGVNKSKEFPNVYHSPAAEATPPWYRSVFQLEVVVKKGDADARIQYANGTVVSQDGLIVSVLDAPGANDAESGGIQSATVLLLDGSGVPAQLVAYEPAYGVGIFRAPGLDVRPLALSETPPVADRRVSWHTVYKDGRKTILYSRPLRVHKATHQVAETADLCEIIDPGTSAMTAARSGSALVAPDGTLVAVMGRLEHWQVTPKNVRPRQKLAWAVPAQVIARLLAKAEDH